MNFPNLLLICFIIYSSYHSASAQQSLSEVEAMQQAPLTYAAIKINQQLNIDGRADESVWENAKWSTEYVDISGSKSLKPTYRTRMKMLWDDQHLYIYAQLEEPHIWADITKHDAIIYHNNDFEVFIKPSAQHDTYYEIEVNPLNTILDLMMTKPYRFQGEAMIHWDLKGLKTAVQHQGTLNNPTDTDQYWSVEMAIPFASILAFGTEKTPKINSQWAINFSRVQWQHSVENGVYQRKKQADKLIEEYNWVWSPIGIINMHYPERWGYVQFVESASQEVSLPSAYPIKKLAWNIHYLQQLHFQVKNKYTTTLSELEGYVRFIADSEKFYDIEILTNNQFDYYRLTLKNRKTGEKFVIDHRGNTD